MQIRGPAFSPLRASGKKSQTLEEIKWHSTPPPSTGFYVVANQPEAGFIAKQRGVPGICLHLNKQKTERCVPGERLEGAVVLTLSEPPQGLSLRLEFSGSESLTIVPRRSLGSGGRSVHTASAAPGSLAEFVLDSGSPGRYTWTFVLEPLPSAAPPSVSASSLSGGVHWASVDASIDYALQLVASVQDGRSVRITYAVPVGTSSDTGPDILTEASKSAIVLPPVCFCGSAGAFDLQLKALTRVAAAMGAASTMLAFSVRVTPRGGVRVRTVQAKLVRHLRRRGSGAAAADSDPLATWLIAFTEAPLNAQAAVAPGAESQAVVELSLTLPPKLPPTCTGTLFSLTYELHALIKHTASCDAAVLPVVIY
jgi:hypothetical protein